MIKYSFLLSIKRWRWRHMTMTCVSVIRGIDFKIFILRTGCALLGITVHWLYYYAFKYSFCKHVQKWCVIIVMRVFTAFTFYSWRCAWIAWRDLRQWNRRAQTPPPPPPRTNVQNSLWVTYIFQRLLRPMRVYFQ